MTRITAAVLAVLATAACKKEERDQTPKPPARPVARADAAVAARSIDAAPPPAVAVDAAGPLVLQVAKTCDGVGARMKARFEEAAAPDGPVGDVDRSQGPSRPLTPEEEKELAAMEREQAAAMKKVVVAAVNICKEDKWPQAAIDCYVTAEDPDLECEDALPEDLRARFDEKIEALSLELGFQ